MTWDYYGEGEDYILKEKKKVPKKILDSLDAKGRKKLKKTLQSAEPTEFFGQDFTKLGELIDRMRELKLVKADKTLKVREINQAIMNFGIDEDQKLQLINLIALELEDQNALRILTGAIHDIKNNVTNDSTGDIILSPL